MSLRNSTSVVTVAYGVRPCPTVPEDPWYQPPPLPIEPYITPPRRLPDMFKDFKDILEETRKNNEIISKADRLKRLARKLKKLGMKRLGRQLTIIAAELYDLVEKEDNEN